MSSEKKATHSTQAKTLLGKIVEVVLCAAFPFTLLILYLRLSEHASLLTSLLICAGISVPYVVLAKKFVTVRCASAVCIVQIFSHFGLFMVFILWSWVTIQQALQGVIRLQHDVNSPVCTNITVNNSSESTADMGQDEDDQGQEEMDWLNSEIELVKSVMVYLHYGGLLPLLGLFVYSYLYERTYSVLRTSSSSPSSRQRQASHNAPNPEESPDFITISVKSLFWLIAVCTSGGFILCCTTSVLIIEYLFYEFALAADFSESCEEYIASQKMSYWWIIAYFSMCLSIVVLSCFSRNILKIRAIIINRFELISDDELIMAAVASGNVGMQRSGGRNGSRQTQQDENNIVIMIPRELRQM